MVLAGEGGSQKSFVWTKVGLFSVTDFDNFIEKDVEHPPRFVWTVDTVEKKRRNIHTNVFLCLSFSFSFSASLSFFLNRFQFKTWVLIFQRWCKVSGNPQLYIFQSCIKFLRRCQLETIEENRDHLTAANKWKTFWDESSARISLPSEILSLWRFFGWELKCISSLISMLSWRPKMLMKTYFMGLHQL